MQFSVIWENLTEKSIVGILIEKIWEKTDLNMRAIEISLDVL